MSKFSWLKCEITRGMFPDEWAVKTNVANNEVISLFAPESVLSFSKSKNSNEKMDGFLKVEIIDKTNDFSLVSLPRPSLEESNYVKVPNSELQEVAG